MHKKSKNMAKKILEVFNTATDAYLEYLNEFVSQDSFADFYDLDEEEVETLFAARRELDFNDPFACIDYHFNKLKNKNYTETEIHY